MAAIELTVPRNYSEMTPKQIRYVAALKMYGLPEKDIWRRCFIKFSGIKPLVSMGDDYVFAKKGLKGFFAWKLEEMSYFVGKMKWITRDYAGIKPVPVFGLKSCDELLRDTKFIQYLDAENHYEAFIFTEDAGELALLAATLYQSGSEYNNNYTPKLARKLNKNKAVQFIALMWMLGVKQEFSRKWPYLFPKSKGDTADEVEEDDFEPAPPDMERIIRNQLRMLTKGDITKETDVLNKPTYSALDELNTQCFEYEKLKSKANS